MEEKVYDDYLEELDYIFIELGKEYAKISTELNTLTASHGGVDGFYSSILNGTCTYSYDSSCDSETFYQIRKKIRARADVIKRISCIRKRIKDVERNKEKIFIKKEPGYELLRGE